MINGFTSVYERIPKKEGFYDMRCTAGHIHKGVHFYKNKFGNWVWYTGKFKCGYPFIWWREGEKR